MGLGGKLLRGLPFSFQPGVDGSSSSAEEADDVAGGLPLLEQVDSPVASMFEFLGSSYHRYTAV